MFIVIAAPLLLPLVFGPRYTPVVPIFQLLVLAYGVQAVIWPALTVLIVLDQPRTIVGLNVVMLIAVGAGYVVFVPRLGAVGAAMVPLGAYTLLLMLSLLVARRALHNHDRKFTYLLAP